MLAKRRRGNAPADMESDDGAEPTVKQAAEKAGFYDPGIPPQLYTLWRGQVHQGVQNWGCFGAGESGSER